MNVYYNRRRYSQAGECRVSDYDCTIVSFAVHVRRVHGDRRYSPR